MDKARKHRGQRAACPEGVERNSTCGQRSVVRLQKIRFYPVESQETGKGMFRTGQRHRSWRDPETVTMAAMSVTFRPLPAPFFMAVGSLAADIKHPNGQLEREKNEMSQAGRRGAFGERLSAAAGVPLIEMPFGRRVVGLKVRCNCEDSSMVMPLSLRRCGSLCQSCHR